jgi:hypothetical protein
LHQLVFRFEKPPLNSGIFNLHPAVSYQGKAQLAEVLLTTISATAPSIGASLAQLISGGSGGTPTPVATSTNSAASPSTTSSGPATLITLSDQAKAAAAARAQSDQTAADNLQAYVDAHRVTGNATKAAPTGSLQSILDANTQPTGTSPADAQPATGSSKVAAIVAQIKTLANANEPPPFQSFVPSKSLSNSLTVDGFTLTVDTNASTQFYGTALSGNGTLVLDKHFGSEDEAGGGTGAAPGVGVSTAEVNNNEALDAVTVTRNIATASSASISSSSAGSISTSSVNAQSSSFTFLVNYATGQISVEGSAASVSAQSTRVSSPGSTLSALA